MDVACSRSAEHSGVVYGLTSSGLLCLFNASRVLEKWVDLHVRAAVALSSLVVLVGVGCSVWRVILFVNLGLLFFVCLCLSRYQVHSPCRCRRNLLYALAPTVSFGASSVVFRFFVVLFISRNVSLVCSCLCALCVLLLSPVSWSLLTAMYPMAMVCSGLVPRLRNNTTATVAY